MNFALLGTDPQTVELARAVLAAGHQIVWCGDFATESATSFAELFSQPPEDWGDQWESLYDQGTCDAVIVGRGNSPAELRAEQINQLTKNGIASITSFPIVDSVLSYYEIDMARNESDAILHHYNPLVEQKGIIEELHTWVQQQHPQLGSIEQVVWHRPLATRSREQALWHFARDVELLDQVAGRLNRLGAHGSPDQEATYAGLSVQLLGKTNVPVRWEVGPVQQSASSQLTLIAAHGSIIVEFNERGQAIQLETRQGDDSQSTPLEPCDAANAAITHFVAVINSQHHQKTTWPSALHAMELADTIEISLRRGRMIDVHHQQLTEQMAFKGTMSALGCGVLMILPPLLLLIGWLAELAGLPVASYWPHALLMVFLAFLVFQFLPQLLLPTSNDTQSEQ